MQKNAKEKDIVVDVKLWRASAVVNTTMAKYCVSRVENSSARNTVAPSRGLLSCERSHAPAGPRGSAIVLRNF